MTTISLWIECASETGNPGGFATRLLREGRAFLHELLGEAYANGVRRAVLHRPNGESLDGGENMNQDSRQDLLRDPDARRVLDGWPAFVAECAERYPGLRLTAYFGTIDEPDFARLLREQKISTLLARFAYAMKPFIDAPNCDIAFDKAGRLGADDVYGALINAVRCLLRAGGRAVAVEPQPQAWSVTAGYPVLVLERHWRRHAVKSRAAGVTRVLSGHELDAEDSPYPKRDPLTPMIEDCLKAGCDIAVAPGLMDYESPLVRKLLAQEGSKR